MSFLAKSFLAKSKQNKNKKEKHYHLMNHIIVYRQLNMRMRTTYYAILHFVILVNSESHTLIHVINDKNQNALSLVTNEWKRVFLSMMCEKGYPDTSPTDTSPTDTSPTDTSPTDTSPTDTSPTDTSPTDTSPTDTSPTDTSPTDTSRRTPPRRTVPQRTPPRRTVPRPNTCLSIFSFYNHLRKYVSINLVNIFVGVKFHKCNTAV